MPRKTNSSDESVGRNVRLSKIDNIAFKQLLIDLEKKGCKKSPNEIANETFQCGIYEMARRLRNEES